MPETTTRERILRSALAQVTTADAHTLPEDGHLQHRLGIDSLALTDPRTHLDRLTPTSGTDTHP
ncbi:hypothetical protein OHS33_34505 [Streptomyces sp. NBC_00536]|uniref:hypothetical protein n=1 Tax=Streptomyces sp. NBC_00536 TaxID=2975769 RepID=UPI002E801019|nr:hypothetical protein [Streptomyces sp. NBC_00536]WUC83032.1 hypothetical protein OHS33_34505 [Streptomyces sp. NBC_00536]